MDNPTETMLRERVAALEIEIDGIKGERSGHLHTIALLQAEIRALRSPRSPRIPPSSTTEN